MVLKTKMSCPICEGEAKLVKETVKLFGGAISLKDNPIYECTKCKERFATGEMVDQTLQKAKSQFRFERKVVSTGGSLAITMPSDLSAYYKLKKGGKIQIVPQSAKEMKIVIE